MLFGSRRISPKTQLGPVDGAAGHATILMSLQAARGIAALAVVICHSALAAAAFGGRFPALRVFNYGRLGVDFFFVLSGFIIYHSTVGRGRSIQNYAVARFRRVYLPYWPIGIGIALLYVAFPTVSDGHRSWSWLSTLLLLPIDVRPALNVAWTLQHEILFYLLFGLLYYGRLLWLGLAVWAVAILAGLPHLVFEPINLEFLFGIAACILYRQGRANWQLALLAPVAAGIAWWAKSDVFVGLMFALLIAPIAQLENAKRFALPKPLILLGAASYSLYLIHLPLISVVARLTNNVAAIFALGIGVSILAGFAYHHLVELRVVKKRLNPEVFAGRGWLFRRSRNSAITAE